MDQTYKHIFRFWCVLGPNIHFNFVGIYRQICEKTSKKTSKNKCYIKMYVCTFARFAWFLSCFPGQTFKHICWCINSKATKIEMYVSKTMVNIKQNTVLTSPVTVNSSENLKSTITCIQIAFCCMYVRVRTLIIPKKIWLETTRFLYSTLF